jgi:hypothetical protein
MADDLDRLLAAPLLEPPEDFAGGVMARVARMPVPDRPSRLGALVQWVALIAAGGPVAAELAAFVLSMWTASSAG